MDVKETEEMLKGEKVESRGEVWGYNTSHDSFHSHPFLTLWTLICRWHDNTSIMPCHLITPSSHRVLWINIKTEFEAMSQSESLERSEVSVRNRTQHLYSWWRVSISLKGTSAGQSNKPETSLRRLKGFQTESRTLPGGAQESWRGDADGEMWGKRYCVRWKLVIVVWLARFGLLIYPASSAITQSNLNTQTWSTYFKITTNDTFLGHHHYLWRPLHLLSNHRKKDTTSNFRTCLRIIMFF